MSRRLALSLAAVGFLALGGAATVHLVGRGTSLCAAWSAETGEGRYLDASWWTCFWSQQKHLAHNSEGLGAIGVAKAAEDQRRDVDQRARAARELALIAEMRQPVCKALDREPLRPSTEELEVDLLGLSGHGSLYALAPVCRQCADLLGTFYDSGGKEFCHVGGKGGKTCAEAAAFTHTGEVNRRGDPGALRAQFGCEAIPAPPR